MGGLGSGRRRNPESDIIRPTITQDEYDALNKYRRIKKEAEDHDIDVKDIKHAWIKSEEASIFIKNPYFSENALTKEAVEETFKMMLESYQESFLVRNFRANKLETPKALKATLSDDHIGMNPNPNGNSLFQYEYNAEIYNQGIEKVFYSILKEYNTHGTFDVIFLQRLGDAADGWNGYTTRGGHELPQNMTNAEVFQTCVDANVRLIRNIIESGIANKVVMWTVSNDNHAGDFGLIINMAVKTAINLMYSEDVAEIDILEKFIEHRTYGDHCFLMTHGKDKKEMKRGLPLVLNPLAENYLNKYIRHYNIDSKYIHVEKGDLHQIGYGRCLEFDYRNFMSFAPPSNWVQHNFGPGYSGYSIQVIPKHSNEISHTDYFIEYAKKD